MPIRFLAKVIPLDVICHPHITNFQQMAVKMLPKLFQDAKEGATWHCSFTSRAMNTIKLADAIKACKDVLRPMGFDMECSEADYVIVIEVNPTLCGFSVLQSSRFEDSMFSAICKKYVRQTPTPPMTYSCPPPP